MLDLILGRQDLTAARAALLASARKGDSSVVHEVEAAVAANPSKAIAFDAAGFATVTGAGRTWAGGRFEVVMVGALLRRVKGLARSGPRRRPRLSVVSGVDALTDIGALQATDDGDTVFQVASQFNCLEAPGPHLTSVASYFTDPTQGPRASISAFPGTLVRHYAAPGRNGERFVQTDASQLDLLEHVCPPSVAKVKGGYLSSQNIHDPRAFAAALEANFEQVQVGVHEGVEAVLGFDWDGLVTPPASRHVAQVFTSTFAGGGYSASGDLDGMKDVICGHLLRAAYMGTLLAAASLGKRRVLLTLIGGGVFSNPHRLIWQAILSALTELEAVAPEAIDVVVNAREGIGAAHDEVLARIENSGGVFCELGKA
ncbi:MAG: hypothetical protein Q8N26_02670 [Myxococcales bacterium]|nr:hypothetical protein [Myxococcales bacterium]